MVPRSFLGSLSASGNLKRSLQQRNYWHELRWKCEARISLQPWLMRQNKQTIQNEDRMDSIAIARVCLVRPWSTRRCKKTIHEHHVRVTDCKSRKRNRKYIICTQAARHPDKNRLPLVLFSFSSFILLFCRRGENLNATWPRVSRSKSKSIVHFCILCRCIILCDANFLYYQLIFQNG